MNNNKIAESLEQLADLLEFQGANPFRLRAYRNGARAIRDLPDSVEFMLENDQDLTQLEGIGKGVAQKCQELVETGKLQQLEEILSAVPRSVLDLLNVPKLGPKKAAALFHELEISSLDQLRDACQQGRVRELSGFGIKTEQQILDGIAIATAANQRILWAEADELARELRAHLLQCESVRQLEFGGSYRRGRDTVGDLDVLVESADSEAVMDHLLQFDDIHSVIARGETKLSVRLDNEFQIDLRVVPKKSFGAALQYFTGSKQHNVKIRSRARQMGLKVNEWGVFKIDGDQENYVAGKSEKEVYEALGLAWMEPEIREARGEIELAESDQLPQLIEVNDIAGDLHMHTTATDGKNTIEEMAQAARERGLQYIAITDHSKRVTMANGLTGPRLLGQWKSIDQINQRAEDEFRILKGIECDILENGEMDLDDKTLAKGDWVIASIHYGQSQSRQQITDRIVGAIQHPSVTMVAHPTGRLLNRRPAYDVDMEAVIQAAREHGKLLELNSHPRRLDLNDVHLIAAKNAGVPVVINTDAHQTTGLDMMRFGIKQARRAGIEKQDVANTRGWRELLELIGRD